MATPRWELTVEARAHSDMLPLSRWGDDDAAEALGARGGQRGRNLAYIDNEIRVSRGSPMGTGPGRISLLARQSATLVASRGAVELAADAQTAGRPPADRRWDVHARYLAFAGSGLAWQHGVSPAADWQLQGGVQALVLRDWRERLIDGTAGYTAADGRYTANLSSFEGSDRLLFPYQQAFGGHGSALLFDAELRWAGERFSAGLGVRDAGRLRWRGLPQNESRLNTNTRSVDPNGFVLYQPLVEGRNTQPRRQRAAPLRVQTFVAWQADAATRLELAAEHVTHFGLLPRFGVEHALGAWRIGAGWHVYERRATASVGWRGLQLRVGMDAFGGRMRSRELALAGSWPL